MKKILVTGGAGFVGTNLCNFLIKKGYSEVFSLDNYSSGNRKNHINGVTYVEGNTIDINSIFKSTSKFDHIFHLGEYSKISTSFKDYQTVFDYNIKGTSEVIKYCIENKSKIIYAASSTKFAIEGDGHSPYSHTKSQNVNLIKSSSNWFSLDYSICYFYNNFGPYHDTCNSGYETVISIFEKQRLRGEKLTICAPGTQERNYTHVFDTVEGLYKSSLRKINDEYQLASEEKYSLFDLANLFECEYKIVEGRKGDRMKGVDSSILKEIKKTKQKLNWKTKYSLSDWVKKRGN